MVWPGLVAKSGGFGWLGWFGGSEWWMGVWFGLVAMSGGLGRFGGSEWWVGATA